MGYYFQLMVSGWANLHNKYDECGDVFSDNKQNATGRNISTSKK
jgi:hypothetical protein